MGFIATLDILFPANSTTLMIKKICVIFVCLISQVSFAAQRSLSCSFKGVKKNAPSVDLGFVKKSIHPDYDFSIEMPKTENQEWSSTLATLQVSGSNETPEKGWIGLAFSVIEKQNDGWACIKLAKGQGLILTRSFGELTVQARCTVN